MALMDKDLIFFDNVAITASAAKGIQVVKSNARTLPDIGGHNWRQQGAANKGARTAAQIAAAKKALSAAGLAGWGYTGSPKTVFAVVSGDDDFNNLTSLQLQLWWSEWADLTTVPSPTPLTGPDDLYAGYGAGIAVDSGAIPLAGLEAGTILLNAPFPNLPLAGQAAFLTARAIVSGTAPTKGKITFCLRTDQAAATAAYSEPVTGDRFDDTIGSGPATRGTP